MGELAYLTLAFESHTCGECGTVFAMLKSMLQARRNDGATFYCPVGHPRCFTGPSEAEKLKKQLEAKERELAQEREYRSSAHKAREHAENTARTLRGHVTRIKNRVGNGVCPCCNRTFQNVMKHMKTKHPNYAKDEPTRGEGGG